MDMAWVESADLTSPARYFDITSMPVEGQHIAEKHEIISRDYKSPSLHLEGIPLADDPVKRRPHVPNGNDIITVANMEAPTPVFALVPDDFRAVIFQMDDRSPYAWRKAGRRFWPYSGNLLTQADISARHWNPRESLAERLRQRRAAKLKREGAGHYTEPESIFAFEANLMVDDSTISDVMSEATTNDSNDNSDAELNDEEGMNDDGGMPASNDATEGASADLANAVSLRDWLCSLPTVNAGKPTAPQAAKLLALLSSCAEADHALHPSSILDVAVPPDSQGWAWNWYASALIEMPGVRPVSWWSAWRITNGVESPVELPARKMLGLTEILGNLYPSGECWSIHA
jgi:hypothetical protein